MNLHSELAELTIIGTILGDPDKIDAVYGMLEPYHFHIPLLADIYIECLNQRKETGAVNAFKVTQALREHQAFAGDKGSELGPWIARCMESAMLSGDIPTLSAFTSNARYVIELHAQRTIKVLNERLAVALTNGKHSEIASIKAQIEAVSLTVPKKQAHTTAEQLKDAYSKLSAADQMMLTGVSQWDAAFGGLSKKARYVIAAYAGAGKTAMACQIALNVAKSGRKVRYMLFEETADKIWARMVARDTKTPMWEFKAAHGMTQRGAKAFHAANENFNKLDLLMFEAPQNVAEMIDLAGACDLIVIDGVSSFPAPPEYTKVDKAGYVSDQCAKLSQHTGAAILMLSHVNSDAVKSGPNLAGIYGGQAASFDPEGILEIRRTDEPAPPGQKSIGGLVLKNRYGEVGVRMNFLFDGSVMTYHEVPNGF